MCEATWHAVGCERLSIPVIRDPHNSMQAWQMAMIMFGPRQRLLPGRTCWHVPHVAAQVAPVTLLAALCSCGLLTPPQARPGPCWAHGASTRSLTATPGEAQHSTARHSTAQHRARPTNSTEQHHIGAGQDSTKAEAGCDFGQLTASPGNLENCHSCVGSYDDMQPCCVVWSMPCFCSAWRNCHTSLAGAALATIL